ncbi:hypothetical protein EON83_08640 [bacterium]|nr:MAG: hypothetical protein EON83_08640 [bacterium]
MNTCLLATLLLATTTTVGACAPAPPKTTKARPLSVEATFKTKRHQWQQHKPRNYRFTLRVLAFSTLSMAGPISIEVRNGVTYSIKPLEKSPYFKAEYFASYSSIDKIFQLIEQAIRNKERVEVSYDSKWGYPVRATLDPMYPDGRESITLSNFKVINPASPQRK